MPVYEYICDGCLYQFTEKRPSYNELATVCPRCGSEVRQIYPVPAIHYRGSGFYTTDKEMRHEQSEN